MALSVADATLAAHLALAAAMPRSRLWLAAALAVALPSSGCTLAKPLVCAVTMPVYVFAQGSGDYCGCDGRAIACAFAIVAIVGAAGGLVTGIISDVNVLCGVAAEPCRNFGDPFATNTSGPWLGR